MPQVITSCEKRSPKSKKRQKVLVVYNPAAGSANVSYYRSILRALDGLGVFVIERRTEKRAWKEEKNKLVSSHFTALRNHILFLIHMQFCTSQ